MTRKELALELGISDKTFYNRIKRKGLEIPSGDLSPEDQNKIRKALGFKTKR